jgi:hypothetical protein
VMCLMTCCEVRFPTLRRAVDGFLTGHDVALLVNCQDVTKSVSSY